MTFISTFPTPPVFSLLEKYSDFLLSLRSLFLRAFAFIPAFSNLTYCLFPTFPLGPEISEELMILLNLYLFTDDFFLWFFEKLPARFIFSFHRTLPINPLQLLKLTILHFIFFIPFMKILNFVISRSLSDKLCFTFLFSTPPSLLSRE